MNRPFTFSSRWVTLVALSSGIGHAVTATQYELGDSSTVRSIAGTSDTDVLIMRDHTILHFDGKRAIKARNQPVCVSTYAEYGPNNPDNNPSMFPISVDNRDAETMARRFRARPANAPEDGRWQPVDFTTLANDGAILRVYGSGDRMDFRGSVHQIFTARLRNGAWFCEGWHGAFGTTIVDWAFDGESAFVTTENYATPTPYADPEIFPFARLVGKVVGSSATGIHGVWAWDGDGATTYHLNGFLWDVRPIENWAGVARVQGAGHGRAWAIGSTTERPGEDSNDMKSDSLGLWNGRAWATVTLPEGFTVQSRGLLVDSTDRVLLVGNQGQYYWYEDGRIRADTGPQIRITAVWRSPSHNWFLGGQCGERDCLVKIGGAS